MGEHFTHRIINLDTLIQDLRDLGISSGDTVFIKGNLGAIGLPREIDGDIRKVFFEALCKVIGEDGSVMTTAYTSSYLPWNLSKGKVFTDKSPSTQGGAFAYFLLNIPGRERSRHPECSYVAYGKYAKYLTADHDASSLAYTPFAKLIELNAKMLVFGCHDTNVGMPLGHYMEEYYGLTKRNLLKGLFRVYYFDQDGCKKLFKRTDLGGCFGSHHFYKYFDESGFWIKGAVGKALATCINAKDEFEVWKSALANHYEKIHCDNPDCIYCNLLKPRKSFFLFKFLFYKMWIIGGKIIVSLLKGKNFKDVIRKRIDYSISKDPLFKDTLKSIHNKFSNQNNNG